MILPPPSICELAIDCDYAMYSHFGTIEAAQQYALGLMDLVNIEWERDVNIQFQVTHVLMHTEPGTTNLTDCRTDWNLNHSDIPHDCVLQLTGVYDANYWGGAWRLGAVGTIDAFANARPLQMGSDARAANLIAHELGHLFNAQHDVLLGDDFTMVSGIGSLNQFSPASIQAITAFKSSLHCLNVVGPPIHTDTQAPAISNFALNPKGGRFISPTVTITDDNYVRDHALYMDGHLFALGGQDWTNLKLPDNKHHEIKVWAVDQDGNVAWSQAIGVH